MMKTGTVKNKYYIDTAKGRKYILLIKKACGGEYTKEVTSSTFQKMKLGQNFKYFEKTPL